MDLGKLEAALAAFSVLEPTALPLHHVQVFLVVAQKGPILYDDIERTWVYPMRLCPGL
jgi:hypothetical protein